MAGLVAYREINVAERLPHDYRRPFVKWRGLGQITRIVVHWPGDEGGRGYADYLLRLEALAEYHLAKNWAGAGEAPAYGFSLMYHRVVAPDGTLYLTAPLELVTWHAHSPANETALAILVDVGLNEQPTAAQRTTLLAYLEQLTLHTPQLPAGVRDVYGHREMPNNATNCPGAVMALVEEWRKGHGGAA